MDHILGTRINPDIYTRRPAIIQAAKNNAYYIGRLKQHLEDFDRDLSEWKESGEWKKDYKSWGLACEVALGIGRCWADRLIKRYNESPQAKVGTIVPVSSDTEKTKTLAKVNTLPNPVIPEIELERPRVVAHTEVATAPPKPKVNGHDRKLENGETLDDYKRERATLTESGKPIHAMAVWGELEDHIGKAINKADAVNKLLPNKDEHQGLIDSLRDAYHRAQRWHAKSRKA